eukprot:TRINITY_DN9580_c0_g1_i1.p1 TRINITY_DN9580_c0_g1~~TRINITY_DN9580_c0_g1_i1.p1  ORF type:complete len:282 (+),score=80.96 TRINITY_DN9580_c0_g1_i1:42-887(+)
MAPPSFNDLYKPVKDLLTKNYNGSSHKIEIKTKDALTFNPTVEIKGDKTVGTLTCEGEYDPCSWCHLKLKYAVNNGGTVKATVKADKLKNFKGLSVEGVAELDMNTVGKDAYDLKAEHKVKQSTVIVQAVSNSKGQTVDANGVVLTQGMNLGAGVTFDASGKLKTHKFGGQYEVSEKTTIVGNLENFQKLKLGFLADQKQWKFAGEYDCPNVQAPADAKVTVGTECKLEGGNVFKARFDTANTFGASLQHKLNSDLKLVTSLEIDTKKWSSTFGSQLVYEN